MDKRLKFTFHDEPVTKYCYDYVNKELHISFEGYFDEERKVYIDKPCTWFIYDWKYAKSKIGDNPRLYDFDEHIGLFRLILYAEYNVNFELEILVMTLDDRCVTYLFKNPKIKYII